MAIMEFTNSDEVFDQLTTTLGKMVKEVTDWKVVSADDPVIGKVAGEHILIDLSEADQLNWKTNEGLTEDGKYFAVHNYRVTYTLTAYRGKPQVALSRVLQSMGLPFIYDKYFPLGSPWAFSSASSINRMRVPINMQDFERRARVQLIFNVAFTEIDRGVYEDLEGLEIKVRMDDFSEIREFEVDINLNTPPTPHTAG